MPTLWACFLENTYGLLMASHLVVFSISKVLLPFSVCSLLLSLFCFSSPFTLSPSLFSKRWLLFVRNCWHLLHSFLTHTHAFSPCLFSLLPAFVFLALPLLPWLTIEEWFNQGECPPSTLLTSALFPFTLPLSPPPPLLLPPGCRI